MSYNLNSVKYLNLACGENYINNNQWLNCDFIKNKGVKKIDLLGKLPLKSDSIEAIYCSHFIEHIPEDKVLFFLNECKRILKKNGILRLVTLDFEKMVIEYLKRRELQDTTKADYVMTSIIDQFVRNKPGGRLARKIEDAIKSNDVEMQNYINKRSGDVIDIMAEEKERKNRSILQKLPSMVEKLYTKILFFSIS